MAALRLIARSKLSAIILRSARQLEPLNHATPIPVQIQKRWGSYTTSPEYKDPSKYTDYEVTRDPKEWEYVERLLKPKIIPEPQFENKEYPSGWKPPTAKPEDYPYYIRRSRNFMQPVYLHTYNRGMRRLTILKNIQGDIWALETELKEHMRNETGRPIGVRINELVGIIKFRGDFVSLIKRWMDSKGF
ncbi:mitochondrial ribosomal protein L49 [Halictus rubicundus]|uniref:mitochondrial ribosomal protein L49 n=1 Tax=Halictus rubicundus TaxID=77578 RepID=UPI0040369521